MLRLNVLAVAACLLGGCAQMRPQTAFEFAALPAPVIIDRYGVTRTLTVQSAKACLTREPMGGTAPCLRATDAAAVRQ
jgi:hypothetical protein